MEKVVRAFSSFAEAGAADVDSRRKMTPQERVEIFLAIRERAHPDAASQGLARVCRMLERKPG